MTGRLLTAREIGDLLGVSVETVLRWHRSGRLPGGYRLASGVLRWRSDELDAWLEGRREGANVVATGGDVERPLVNVGTEAHTGSA